MRKYTVLIIAGASLVACGGDSNNVDGDAGGATFPAGGTGGDGTAASGGTTGEGMTNTAAGGAGGNDTTTGGNSGADGDDPMMMMMMMMNMPTDGGMFQLECDDSVPTSATCGGTECPEPQGISGMLCTVPCCFEDACGTQNTSMMLGSECGPPAMPDPNCPVLTIMNFDLDPCCTGDGACGADLSVVGMGCTAIEDLPGGASGVDPISCEDAAE